MTLQYEVENLDGLEENIRSLYVEKDGRYFLDVVGHEKNEDPNKIPRSRLNSEIEKRKAAEAAMEQLAEDYAREVPAEMQELIPSDLPAAARVRWLRSAISRGIFHPRSSEPIDPKKPADKKLADFSNMTPAQIMAQGYKKYFF
jgi:hypothetical protein